MNLLQLKNLFSKISIAFFILFFGASIDQTRANDCAIREWYSRYLCQTENKCDAEYDKYSGWKDFNTEQAERSYQDGYNLYIAKNLYRENMNSIYKCAILKSQNNAYSRILNDLNISNPGSSVFIKRITGQQERLEAQINLLDCVKSTPEKQDFNLKKQVLDQSTLEMCKYLHFLDYVDNTHVKDIWNMIKDVEISKQVEQVFEQNPEAWIEAYLELSNVEDYEFQKKKYTVKNILDLQKQANKEIEEEIEHTKKVYEVAFQTYANYESNMIIHLLFGMLENDFREVRNKIYAMLWPINQVAYKIPNATSY